MTEQSSMTSTDLVERVARAIAGSQGCDWDEVCGYEKPEPDNDECGSGTCVAAHFEDHDPDWARGVYTGMARAAITAMPSPDGLGDELIAELEAAPLAAMGTNKVISYDLYERVLTALRTSQADERGKAKGLTDEQAFRELGLLYNYKPDDSRQFTRWQMSVAISHGWRIACDFFAERGDHERTDPSPDHTDPSRDAGEVVDV